MDLLEDHDTHTPDEYATHRALSQNIQIVFANLTPQEREVLTLRFGFKNDTPLSLAKIGNKLDLSRERIRQIQRKAINYVRRYHSADLSEYLAN